ncbi:hypothetical protein [Nonomuraea sp. NPDC050643]|uniref:hypothetical protein n=1 Tax=Nonomuraea sp. NPDC050643 TaxID=3155660 RepID=UPI0033EAA9ED
MGYESFYSRPSDPGRQPIVAGGPVPARAHFQRRLRRPWVVNRLKREVTGLMSHAGALRAAATGPSDTLVASLRNAKVAVQSLQTELSAWGLLETRKDGSNAGVELLLEFDIAEELARHGITLDWPIEERFARLRRLLQEQASGRPDPTPTSSGTGGGLKALLEAALSAIEELLESQDVHDSGWREKARKLLGVVSELLTTLTVGLVAVGLTVLAIDESLAQEMTKKVIEILAAAMTLPLILGVREALKPPDIAAVLAVADNGVRSGAGRITAIMKRTGWRRPLSTLEAERVRHLVVCLTGHVYTVERLVELADHTGWPEAEEYVSVCRNLHALCDRAAKPDQGAFNGWWQRRSLVASLNETVMALGSFSIPDDLPLNTRV